MPLAPLRFDATTVQLVGSAAHQFQQRVLAKLAQDIAWALKRDRVIGRCRYCWRISANGSRHTDEQIAEQIRRMDRGCAQSLFFRFREPNSGAKGFIIAIHIERFDINKNEVSFRETILCAAALTNPFPPIDWISDQSISLPNFLKPKASIVDDYQRVRSAFCPLPFGYTNRGDSTARDGQFSLPTILLFSAAPPLRL